jgi:hypothetical protein
MTASHLRPTRRSSFRSQRIPLSLLAASLAITTCSLTPSARAAAINDSVPTPEMLAQLEQHASQASPREQAYLYTEIVHTMTEKAAKEFSDGDDSAAQATLKQINHYAHLIQTSLERNTSKLKNAEMLMQHTTYRFAQFVHLAPPDEKPQVQATLQELTQVNDALLTQVFKH